MLHERVLVTVRTQKIIEGLEIVAKLVLIREPGEELHMINGTFTASLSTQIYIDVLVLNI